jgi:urease accessory protein
MTIRAVSHVRAGLVMEKPFAIIDLDAQDRHVRRKLLKVSEGLEVLVDFEKPVKLGDGDCLVLDDGRYLQVAARDEELLEVRAVDGVQLARLAWHIGNRHLEAQIETDRILIRPDKVIAHMLELQGAKLKFVREKFSPEHGAYAHGH